MPHDGKISMQSQRQFPNSFLTKLVHAVLAEVVWLTVGGAVGFLGPFIAAQLRTGRGAQALSFLPIVSVPACALLSAGVAVFFLRSSFETRVAVCGAVNAAMFATLLLFGTMSN